MGQWWDHGSHYTCLTPLAELQADREISKLPDSDNCGATSSVALIQTLDEPPNLFYNADTLLITVAHCG